MKKIQDKITYIFNRYIIFFKNSIIKKIKDTEIFIKIKIGFISFITLSFLFSKKVNLSIFSRYLVLLIILLFTFLFYLSIPTLYNYGEIQKDLNKKLLNEFNLNTSLSANITYKILPTPNFEISNVFLTNDSKSKFDDFVQIKKMKINRIFEYFILTTPWFVWMLQHHLPNICTDIFLYCTPIVPLQKMNIPFY